MFFSVLLRLLRVQPAIINWWYDGSEFDTDVFFSRFGGDVQLTMKVFDQFGKNFAKSIKQSPDALFQVIEGR